MLNMIPGGRRIKKYLYRMIFGLIILPLGMMLLIWNESQAISKTFIIPEYNSELGYWGFRLAGFIILLWGSQRILSFIKLFMMKIPLSYNEIRAGIWITSIMASMATFLTIISVSWIYTKPRISLILLSITLVLLLMLFIRNRQQKKMDKTKIPSAKPHQVKDT